MPKDQVTLGIYLAGHDKPIATLKKLSREEADALVKKIQDADTSDWIDLTNDRGEEISLRVTKIACITRGK